MSKNGYWVPAEIEDKEQTYTFESHSPQPLKGTPWVYCRYCGLVYLNNSISKWSIKMGCNSSLHPLFKQMLNKSTRRAKPWGRKRG
jgi:hypothetical protein